MDENAKIVKKKKTFDIVVASRTRHILGIWMGTLLRRIGSQSPPVSHRTNVEFLRFSEVDLGRPTFWVGKERLDIFQN